ncbi:hypothetical protein [Solibacillus sp. FSL K6-1523]|uniref:hypothetical protein n=1 Tax=Solibacillus sp. FSL K6-1523 TaxID=2921471 RepID=UPI0030F9C07C
MNLKEYLKQLEESHIGLEVRGSHEKLDKILSDEKLKYVKKFYMDGSWQLYFHQGTISPLQLSEVLKNTK